MVSARSKDTNRYCHSHAVPATSADTDLYLDRVATIRKHKPWLHSSRYGRFKVLRLLNPIQPYPGRDEKGRFIGQERQA